MIDPRYKEVAKIATQKTSKQFVEASIITDVLERSFIMSMRRHRMGNAILWGPGGFGKTNVTEAWLRAAAEEMDLEFGIIDAKPGMTLEDLLAGRDIKGYLQDNTLRYNAEQSLFMTKDIIFLEEGLDMHKKAFEALKSIITSGRIEVAPDEFLDVKVKLIVIATNTSPHGFEGDSLRAFFQRFKYEKCINFQDYTSSQYKKIVKFIIGKNGLVDEFPKWIEESIAEIAFAYKWSPRSIGDFLFKLAVEADLKDSSEVTNHMLTSVSAEMGLDADDTIRRVQQEMQQKNAEGFVEAMRSFSQMQRESAVDAIERAREIEPTLDNAKSICAKSLTYLAETATEIESYLNSDNLAKISGGYSAEYGTFGREGAQEITKDLAETMQMLQNEHDRINNALVNSFAAKMSVAIPSSPLMSKGY